MKQLIISNKSIIPFTIVVCLTLAVWFTWLYPALHSVQKALDYFAENFVSPTPELILMDGGIEFVDNVSDTMYVQNDFRIIFNVQEDTSFLYKTDPSTLVITPSTIYYNYKGKIKSFSLSGIKVDRPVHLTPKIVSQSIQKYSRLGFYLLSAFGMALLFIIQLITVLIGAGLATVTDAFSQGKFSFSQLFTFSGFVYLGFILLLFILHPRPGEIYGFWHVGLIAFFVIIFILTLILPRFYNGMNPSAMDG